MRVLCEALCGIISQTVSQVETNNNISKENVYQFQLDNKGKYLPSKIT